MSDKKELILILGRLGLVAENLDNIVKKLNELLIYTNEMKKGPKLEKFAENFFNDFLKHLFNKKDKYSQDEIHQKWMEKLKLKRSKVTVSCYLSKLCRAGYIKAIRDKSNRKKKNYILMYK